MAKVNQEEQKLFVRRSYFRKLHTIVHSYSGVLCFCKALPEALRIAFFVAEGRRYEAHKQTLSETLNFTLTLNAFYSIIYARNNVRFLPVTVTYMCVEFV